MNHSKLSVRTLTMLALLTAMSIIFARVLTVSTGFLRFNLGALPTHLAAVWFGPAGGFVCNYIGISVGSIIAYFLARKYGVSIVKSLFKEKTYQKWEAWIGRQKYFPLALFMAILLPLFPDDFFCYFSGLTTMKPRRFIWIILIGKPWCILAYSLIFGGIL